MHWQILFNRLTTRQIATLGTTIICYLYGNITFIKAKKKQNMLFATNCDADCNYDNVYVDLKW